MIPSVRAGLRLLALFLALLATAAGVNAQQDTASFQWISTRTGLSLHKEMFMLPATISNEFDGAQTEAVFQISAKYRIFHTPFYFAYSQISFWQAFDAKNSAPFRETNYNPEFFYRSNRLPFQGGLLGVDLGFEHESNGQIPPVSRSWNLFYAAPYYFRSDWLVYLKVRYRVPEGDKVNPLDAEGDDNPDITDYLGYTDLHFFYRFPWHHTCHLDLEGNFNTGRAGVVFNYNIPVPKGVGSYLVFRISHGWGESLVDYKKNLTRFGIGIMFGE